MNIIEFLYRGKALPRLEVLFFCTPAGPVPERFFDGTGIDQHRSLSSRCPVVVQLVIDWTTTGQQLDNDWTTNGVGPCFLWAGAVGGTSVTCGVFSPSFAQYSGGRRVIQTMTTMRRIAPYILLAAYMPLLAALSFHTHTERHSEASECPDCAHHLHHKAHLAGAAVMAHDCVYCQLTSSSYYASRSVPLPAVPSSVAMVADACGGRVAAVSYALPSFRAPPLQ